MRSFKRPVPTDVVLAAAAPDDPLMELSHACLKRQCAVMRLHVSGPKLCLVQRIRAACVRCATHIQRVFRGHLVREVLRLGQYKTTPPCANPYDFASLEPLDEIAFPRFFSFHDDAANVRYGFDIDSFCRLLDQDGRNSLATAGIQNQGPSLIRPRSPLMSQPGRQMRRRRASTEGDESLAVWIVAPLPSAPASGPTYITIVPAVTNPYTRNSIPADVVTRACRVAQLGRVFRGSASMDISASIPLSTQKRIEMRALDLFQRMDAYGSYTDFQWFTGLNRAQLMEFLDSLVEIWDVRARLTMHMRRQICPPHGMAFDHFRVEEIVQTRDIHVAQTHLLDIMEIMITSGQTRDDCVLGTYFVLGALTTVSRPAQLAYEWLYLQFFG